MKHLARVTVSRATVDTPMDIEALLARIFAFALDVMQLKGKGGTQPV
jgi:hypothetical protein